MMKIRGLKPTSGGRPIKESGEKHFFTKSILKIYSGEKHLNPKIKEKYLDLIEKYNL